jgi:hypothetical protein
MRQQRQANTPASLFSVGMPSAEIQIVATSTGLVLDVQAENIGTDGHPHRCHAVARLPLDAAMQFETALQSAIDAAWGLDHPITERSDPRQTVLWSNATLTETIRRAA